MMRAVLFLWVFVLAIGAGIPQYNSSMVKFLREYLSIKYADKSFDQFIHVAAKQQKLDFIKGGAIKDE